MLAHLRFLCNTFRIYQKYFILKSDNFFDKIALVLKELTILKKNNKKNLASSERIRLLMFENKLTQREFSKLTGVKESSVNHYYQGRYQPTNVTAEMIAKAFKVNPLWVMGFDVEREDYKDVDSQLSYLIDLYKNFSQIDRKRLVDFADYLVSYYSPDAKVENTISVEILNVKKNLEEINNEESE